MSSFLVLGDGILGNRWRDGQVCPDVDKELWRLGPDGSGEEREETGREKSRTRNGWKEKGEETEEREFGRESAEPALYREKGWSPDIGVKDDERRMVALRMGI
ncbi:hypothetical protein TNCV_4103921 [Trichonephila clavipes]|nr:hypothetical protein TNCV_4103921 [Trichonephila clavipes]